MDELASTKRQLIETYLFLNRFNDVRSRDEIHIHFRMNHEGVRNDLTVGREWIELPSQNTIAVFAPEQGRVDRCHCNWGRGRDARRAGCEDVGQGTRKPCVTWQPEDLGTEGWLRTCCIP